MIKSYRALLYLALVLALPILGCGLLTGQSPAEEPTTAPQPTDTLAPQPTATDVPPTDTPQPQPTATQAAQATQPPQDSPETKEPLPTLPGGISSEAALSSTTYTHPQGFVSLRPPQGWEITDDEASTSIEAPDGSGFIYVQVTNTGYALDASAFTTFVENRDLNFFTGFDDYVEIGQDVDTETGVASITKNLSFEGTPQTVITVYDQYDAIIYTYDFWSDDENLDAYSDLYTRLIDTIDVDPSAAAEQDEYYWIYTFTGPDALFTIDVPTPWRYEQTEGDFAIVDTFYAPDDHAVIQNITYDDGTEISRSQAGAFALELLRDYYATDINILGDQVQPDGSERLIWTSPGGEYSGTSFLETRGTTFLLFTTMYDDAFEDVYLETLDYTIGTYEVPES